jgi:hypothetical protein
VKIGNIVSDSPLKVGEEFNIVDSFDDVIEGIPTLIVGHSIVKTKFGEDLNFVDRKVDNIYWTFTKQEHKKYHTPDLNNFIDLCFNTSVENIDYVFVDPIQFTKKTMKKVINKILSLDEPISYLSEKNMLYVFGNNLIFGIDLKLINYIGMDGEKIKCRAKSISKAFLEGNEILIEYKDYLERLNNQPKYIPFLHSISKHE